MKLYDFVEHAWRNFILVSSHTKTINKHTIEIVVQSRLSRPAELENVPVDPRCIRCCVVRRYQRRDFDVFRVAVVRCEMCLFLGGTFDRMFFFLLGLVRVQLLSQQRRSPVHGRGTERSGERLNGIIPGTSDATIQQFSKTAMLQSTVAALYSGPRVLQHASIRGSARGRPRLPRRSGHGQRRLS